MLRTGQLNGHKFRRQVAIGPYIVDFVCLSQKIIVELDGPQHCENDAAENDVRRDAWLHSLGYQVLRFWNYQLDEDFHSVVNQITFALTIAAPNVPHPPSPIAPR